MIKKKIKKSIKKVKEKPKKLEKVEPKVKTDNEIKLERLLIARETLNEYDIHREGQLNNIIDQLKRELM